MKPTLPWDLPVPVQISERIQKYCTVFKKKIEVLEGEIESKCKKDIVSNINNNIQCPLNNKLIAKINIEMIAASSYINCPSY